MIRRSYRSRTRNFSGERQRYACQVIRLSGRALPSCLHMTKLAQEKFPKERAVDWDEQKQVLDIPDPYLLFYLRRSGRLREDYRELP
jgi:hypothetical protein